jgi:hypothetical protein
VCAVALLATSPALLAAQGLRSAPASVSLVVVVPPRHAAPLREIRELQHREVGQGVTDVSAFVGFEGELISRVEVALAGAAMPGVLALFGRDDEGELVPVEGRTRLGLVSDGIAGSRVDLRVVLDTARAVPVRVPLRYRVTLGRGEHARIVEYTDTLPVPPRR